MGFRALVSARGRAQRYLAIVEDGDAHHVSLRITKRVQGGRAMLIEQAHLHRTDWRKLGIAFLFAIGVVAMSLAVRLMT
jgi:hypothetical protein